MTTANRRRRLGQGLILLAFAGVPAVLCQFLSEAPQHRHVHVEAFRYGKEPSVIRCNRGDWLHLTFSTRDTGHSFFLEEFDIDAKIISGDRNVTVFRTSKPDAQSPSQREVVFRAEHPGWLRFLVSKSQYRCHTWCGPMHAFEHGNLIIWPNTLLSAGLGLVLGIPVVGLIALRGRLRNDGAVSESASPGGGWNVLRHLPALRRLLKRRGFQAVFLVVTMAFLYLILLTMLFGTKVAGRNLGAMMTWVVWLFVLVVVLVPFGGRIWCLVCPLPMFGDILQRRAVVGVRRGSGFGFNNRFFGLNLPWPKRLANDWPKTIGFLALGTFSTALVAVPRISGFVILGLVLVATGMALVWELRAFCRYLCPVAGFMGLYARSGKLALRAENPEICRKCRHHSCQKGSDQGWACPFGLCVRDIDENADCGMCTECLKTCPYDNVTLRWRAFAEETALRSVGEAWLAMAMLVLGTTYCLVHLGHWPFLRDCVNILDKKNWGLFTAFAAALWLAALVGLPAVMLAIAYAGKRLARAPQRTWTVLRACSGSLVPIGLTVWIAFVVPMFMVNVSFVRQSLSDPFGWGWDFLGTASTPWHQLWPRAIPWIQVVAVLIGLFYSLRNAWRIWLDLTRQPRAALAGMFPMSLFLMLYCGWLVWFLAN